MNRLSADYNAWTNKKGRLHFKPPFKGVDMDSQVLSLVSACL